MKLDIFIHGNITGLNIAMKKITGSINVIISTLTVTVYIRVTQNLKLHMETASAYEGHTSHTSFARLLDPTSGLLRHTSVLLKILPWLHDTIPTKNG